MNGDSTQERPKYPGQFIFEFFERRYGRRLGLFFCHRTTVVEPESPDGDGRLNGRTTAAADAPHQCGNVSNGSRLCGNAFFTAFDSVVETL